MPWIKEKLHINLSLLFFYCVDVTQSLDGLSSDSNVWMLSYTFWYFYFGIGTQSSGIVTFSFDVLTLSYNFVTFSYDVRTSSSNVLTLYCEVATWSCNFATWTLERRSSNFRHSNSVLQSRNLMLRSRNLKLRWWSSELGSPKFGFRFHNPSDGFCHSTWRGR